MSGGDIDTLEMLGLSVSRQTAYTLGRPFGRLLSASAAALPSVGKTAAPAPAAAPTSAASPSAASSSPAAAANSTTSTAAAPSSSDRAALRAAKAAKKAALQAQSSETAAAPAKKASQGAGAAHIPAKLAATDPLPSDEEVFSCISYNVLLPNSQDGWWIYKYYRDPGDGSVAEWTARQKLLEKQFRAWNSDFICLQEISDLSWDSDFAFAEELGYERLLHSKTGRMRPATFWRRDKWELVSALHRDRTLVLLVRRSTGPRKGSLLFVVNGHLSAGPNADRRLRQVEEAMKEAGKEATKMKLNHADCSVIVCGDLNSQGKTGVRELLVAGEVHPDFRESGDPTEKGQQGLQITSKVKKQTFGPFADAAELAFGDAVPATILAANIDSKMLNDDNSLTTGMVDKLKSVFKCCCKSGKDIMTKSDIESFLMAVNKAIGRGSEFRSVEAALEKRGLKLEDEDATLTEDDFLTLYEKELQEGKFWGVEHDLRVLSGRGMAIPEEGPVELCFDHIFFSTTTLRCVGVQEPLAEDQKKLIYGPPFDVLPNSWHPSDHLPVSAAFAWL